jgi:DNA-binding MarR family transcriptional regulator
MAEIPPLDEREELFWRALMRVIISLPRSLDLDLARAAGLTVNEYVTLVTLSEAPDRELRMADLASATGLSASRMTRLVDDLQARGYVVKRPSPRDGRGNVAALTAQGLAKLESAYPHHLASVRSRVLDHIDAASLAGAARALDAVAVTLEGRSARPDAPRHPR